MHESVLTKCDPFACTTDHMLQLAANKQKKYLGNSCPNCQTIANALLLYQDWIKTCHYKLTYRYVEPCRNPCAMHINVCIAIMQRQVIAAPYCCSSFAGGIKPKVSHALHDGTGSSATHDWLHKLALSTDTGQGLLQSYCHNRVNDVAALLYRYVNLCCFSLVESL